MHSDTLSIAELIKQNGITMSAQRTDSNPNMDDSANMDHWKITMIILLTKQMLWITLYL